MCWSKRPKGLRPNRYVCGAVPWKFDRNQQKADERWQQVQRLLNPTAIWKRWIELLDDATERPDHPLAALLEVMRDAPVCDAYDLDGWIQTMPLRAKQALADAVIKCLGESVLTEVARVLRDLDDDTPF
jgi:hypothetical protein